MSLRELCRSVDSPRPLLVFFVFFFFLFHKPLLSELVVAAAADRVRCVRPANGYSIVITSGTENSYSTSKDFGDDANGSFCLERVAATSVISACVTRNTPERCVCVSRSKMRVVNAAFPWVVEWAAEGGGSRSPKNEPTTPAFFRFVSFIPKYGTRRFDREYKMIL